MMTSVGTNRARGNWEQPQNQNQTQHKQRPQATAEQIRLAQMTSDHNDADFEEKVKRLISQAKTKMNVRLLCMTVMEMSTEPSVFSWKEIQTCIPGRWWGRRKESQDRRMVDKLNLMKKEKKIETGTETIVGDVVGHQDEGEVPAVDESFGARKMDWMAPRVEGLLEEAQTEAEEAVAGAEVVLAGEEAGAEVVLAGEEEGFLLKEWEPLTQLIPQSQPTLMIAMAVAVAVHGTTLATLNQMMEQVHGGRQQKNGELKIGMKIFLRPRSLLPLMCLQCLCLRRM